jgi:hypothetical protein
MGRRKFLTLLGLSPTAPLLKQGDIAANVGTGRGADLSGIWFNIADYGDISSGDITTALQATIDGIGANGRCKTIVIPSINQTDWGSIHLGAITWPTPTNGVGWTLLVACGKLQLEATLYLKTGHRIIGFLGGGNGASNGVFGAKGRKIAGLNCDPLISIPQNTVNVLLENLDIEPGHSCGVTVNIRRTNSVVFRNCQISSQGGNFPPTPAVRVDGCFWVDFNDCKFSGLDYFGVHLTSEQPTSDVGGGLSVFRNCEFDCGYGGVKIDSLYGPIAGNYTFEDCTLENLKAGYSMFNIDSSGGVNISSINIIRCAIADGANPSYLLKNTGNFTNAVRVLQSGNVSIDPSSTAINGLKIELGRGPGEAGLIPYPLTNPSYEYSWPGIEDKRQVATPRGPQWTPGTILNIDQTFTTGWSNHGVVTKTTGILAPDGSTNAVQYVGTINTDNADCFINRTASVGDWIIFGCWIQSHDPTVSPSGTIETILLYGSNASGTETGSGTVFTLDDIIVTDGAWKWCCGARKILTLGSGGNPCTTGLVARFGTKTINYFNPCVQVIPAALGFTDTDVINLMRSYKGGWASQATVAAGGQVGILDHQRFRGNLIVPPLTFATLPSSPAAGMMSYITDSNTSTHGATAAAGGANKVMVWYNGTNWTVMGS